MHRFSIIVPLLDRQQPFEDTLASVLRHRPASSQVIVVHDGTYSDPYGLGGELLFVTVDQLHLANVINRALERTTGEWTLLIRPGVELDEGWETTLEQHLADPDLAAISPLLATPASPDRAIATGIGCGSSGSRKLIRTGISVGRVGFNQRGLIGPTSWLAIWRTTALRNLLPIENSISSCYVDVEIALGLKQLGYQAGLELQWRGLVDCDEALLREASNTSGRDAQRISVRHSLPSRSNAINVIRDTVAAIAKPRLLIHGIQRLAARRFENRDRDFRSWLVELSDAEAHSIPLQIASAHPVEKATKRRIAA